MIFPLTKQKFLNIIIIIILLVSAFFPRYYLFTESEIYPDEVTWTVRSKELFNNLRAGNFNYFQTAWWTKRDDTEAIALPLTFLGGVSLRLFGETVSSHSLRIFSDINAVRLPVVLLNGLFILIFFWYLRQLIDRNLALVTSLLLAWDPIFLWLGRWVLNDSFLTIFSVLGILSFLVADKHNKLSIVPAIFLTFSFLTKPNGVIVVIPWLVVTCLSISKIRFKLLIVNLLLSIMLIYLLWPSMYTNPLYFFEYFLRQTSLTQNGFENYFLGEVTYNPPFYYYLFQLVTRIPTIVVFGLILAVVGQIYKLYRVKDLRIWIHKNAYLIAILIYCVIFYLVIGLSAKKLGVRYLLPLWPWFYIAGIWGWSWILSSVRYQLKITCVVVALIIYLVTFYLYTPDFYFYYNDLIGKPINALKFDIPNLCLGLKSTARSINGYPENIKVAYLGCGASLAAYYSNREVLPYLTKETDLVVIEDSYQKLHSEDEIIKYYNTKKPLSVILSKGITVSKIYLK